MEYNETNFNLYDLIDRIDETNVNAQTNMTDDDVLYSISRVILD